MGNLSETQEALDAIAANLKITVVKIFDLTKAIEVQSYASDIKDGLFVLDAALGRGFDMKMQKQAYVIVVDTTGSVGESAAK